MGVTDLSNTTTSSPTWHLWALRVLPFCFLIFLILMSNFTVLIRWWQQPEGSHAWLIPLISLYILWRRRRSIFAAIGPGSFSGVLMATLGATIYILDSAGNLYQLQIPALALTTIGIFAASFGWASTRFAVAPLVFCVFASPPPDTFYVYLSLQLQLLSSQIGTALLHQFGVSAFLDGNIIDLGVYRLHVAEACSGLRYLFPLIALSFLLAWSYPASISLKLFIFASAIPITILTNSLRIALTGLLVHHFSIAQAEGFMHLFEGWLIFLSALGLLLLLMYGLKRLRTPKTENVTLIDLDRIDGKYVRHGHVGNLPRRLYASTATLLSTVLVLGTAVGAYAWHLGKEPVIDQRRALVAFPQQLEEWQGTASSIGTNLAETLAPSDYLLADYTNAEGNGDIVNLWIAYFEQNSRQGVGHSPQGCLPGAGWEFDLLGRKEAPFSNFAGETFSLMQGIARKDGRRIMLYYWIETGKQQFVDNRYFGLVNAYNALTNKPTDAALVRVVTPFKESETAGEAEERILNFLSLAYPKMKPHL